MTSIMTRQNQNYREYYRQMNDQLLNHLPALVTSFLGLPQHRTGCQWRYGKKLNLVVNMDGSRKGQYYDFETGVGGDALELVKVHTGLQGKELSQWVKAFTGYPSHFALGKDSSTWIPITPIPHNTPAPDIISNKYLNYMLKDGARETHRHAYRDEQGNLKGYVIRIERLDGSKITPPLSWCRNEQGFEAWKWQAFEKENKTPYGLEKLVLNPNKPILIVEGEKTADAAQELLPDFVVLSWCGGAMSVTKTDWWCLASKNVILWPDNDQVGLECMEKLKKLIEQDRAKFVRCVQPPFSTPSGWDLADPLPRDWSQQTLENLLYLKGD